MSVFQDFNGTVDMDQSINKLLKLVVSLILATGGTLFSEWITKISISRSQNLTIN